MVLVDAGNYAIIADKEKSMKLSYAEREGLVKKAIQAGIELGNDGYIWVRDMYEDSVVYEVSESYDTPSHTYQRYGAVILIECIRTLIGV